MFENEHTFPFASPLVLIQSGVRLGLKFVVYSAGLESVGGGVQRLTMCLVILCV